MNPIIIEEIISPNLSAELDEQRVEIVERDGRITISIEASGGWDAGGIELKRLLDVLASHPETRAAMLKALDK